MRSLCIIFSFFVYGCCSSLQWPSTVWLSPNARQPLSMASFPMRLSAPDHLGSLSTSTTKIKWVWHSTRHALWRLLDAVWMAVCLQLHLLTCNGKLFVCVHNNCTIEIQIYLHSPPTCTHMFVCVHSGSGHLVALGDCSLFNNNIITYGCLVQALRLGWTDLNCHSPLKSVLD